MRSSFEHNAGSVELRLTRVALLVVLLLAGAVVGAVAAQGAAVESEDVTISNMGETGESRITVDADKNVSTVDVTVSVDTSVAEITDAREGAGPFDRGVIVNMVNQTPGSVTFEYSDISRSESSFELGVVEFVARTEGEVTDIELSTANFNDDNFEPFDDVDTDEGELRISADGNLSQNNPFGDLNGNPVSRQTVINRVVQWNLNGEINGTSFTRQEIINFVVQWNLAT
jgi:hypothetical protein